MNRSDTARTLGPLLLALSLTACGGGSQEREPLISGAVTGEFEGSSFTIAEGVAVDRSSGSIIALGTEAMNCGTPDQNRPPKGYFASIGLESLEVGSYSNVIVTVYENHGNFSGTGSNNGTVEITSSDAMSVAATVSYSYTDSETGESYALSGDFEVVRCAE